MPFAAILAVKVDWAMLREMVPQERLRHAEHAYYSDKAARSPRKAGGMGRLTWQGMSKEQTDARCRNNGSQSLRVSAPMVAI